MTKILSTQILTIGRNADINISDAKETVSRIHCELLIIDGGYYLRDAKSMNGTFIYKNDACVPLTEAWVSLNEPIILGECKITLDALLGSGVNSFEENEAPEQDKNEVEMPGKRIRCPMGHVVLASLAVCPRCASAIS